MNDVKDSVEFYRNLWAGAEARLADCESSLVQSQAEVAMLRAALVRWTDADALAQAIRVVDGSHSLGAGVLAERVIAYMATMEPTR